MRRPFLGLIALFIVLAAAYAGYWFYTAGNIRAGIDPWADARRAEGYDLRWDNVAVNGFPFEFRVVFINFFASSPKPLPYQASAVSMVFETGPWNLQKWRFTAPGGIKLALLTASLGFDAEGFSGDLTLPLDPEGALDIDALNLAGEGAAQGFKLDELRMGISQPPTPPASDHDPFLDLSFALTNLALPNGYPPLGSTIQQISATAAIDGSFTPGPLTQALSDWRDHGGILDIQNIQLNWDALDASANGTAALDARLQPIAALTATLKGQDAVIDAAVAGGSMSDQNGNLAKAVLALLAKPGPDGTPQITAPVTVQDSRVFLGPAAVAKLPTINWESN